MFPSQRKVHGRGWLEQKLALSNSSSLGVPIVDLVDSIMSVICSSKSDDELQTEVAICSSFLITKFNCFIFAFSFSIYWGLKDLN